MRYLKVKNNPDWIRDMKTGLLMFTNSVKLEEYKNKHKQKRTVEALQTDINNLKEELSVVKSLLTEISERI